MTLRTVLLSLQALLAAPEPDDPQDAVVARQYKENKSLFDRTAQYWTSVHAGGGLNKPVNTMGDYIIYYHKYDVK